jgi:hypothetical protein
MSSKKIVGLGVVLVLVITGLYFISIRNIDSGVRVSFSPQNAVYEIEGAEITLINGGAEVEIAPGSASKIKVSYFGNKAEGDLNGDGVIDQAYLITKDGGGSGVFYYVVAVLHSGENYKLTKAVFLGDRIAPQTTEIRNGQLIVNYAERPVGSPMTERPSMGVSRYLEVVNNELVESAK